VPPRQVLRTYLELSKPGQLEGARVDPSLLITLRRPIAVEHYRRLYREVGSKWHWVDRNFWTDEELAAHLASADVFVWECVSEETSAGYFELHRHDDGSVEIAYFGLLEAAMGRGIGKALLTRAAEEAWALDATRVWLHTCELDSPRALPNYIARGFREVRTETVWLEAP
jgi:GNAT superfamily N-acetyltransferase